MDDLIEQLRVRAATIDELLSDDFEALPGQKDDADVAARRLATWCRSCASGNWTLFEQRLRRDGWSFADVLAKFATVRRKPSAPTPAWVADAAWIAAAVQNQSSTPVDRHNQTEGVTSEPCAFEHLLWPLVAKAETRLCDGLDPQALANLNDSARACLRHALMNELSELCAPVLYQRFAVARQAAAPPEDATPARPERSTALYDRFIADMPAGGFCRLFEDKPVLLRLMAAVTRQWIDTSREFVKRLTADLPAVRRTLLRSAADAKVAKIQGQLSDPHNGGRSVRIVTFADGARVVYKPKDLRLDTAWWDLVQRLNHADAPLQLKAARVLARDGYGWTEFIDHTGCADPEGCRRYFQRAGAWLALFHCFAATDMHQENIIAAGDQPVPIDLEMILQGSVARDASSDPEAQALDAAAEILINSVTAVGLLPKYVKSPKDNIVAVGGMNTHRSRNKARLTWSHLNSDAMRAANVVEPDNASANLPHVGGHYAKFGDRIDDFVAGFEAYAKFLLDRRGDVAALFAGFVGVPVRKIIRPTRLYALLLQRLKNPRVMDDGVVWSAQADFLARLADWDQPDLTWPLQLAERSALLELNVPHFMSSHDGKAIGDAAGVAIPIDAASGIERARARIGALDADEIAWQIEVVRQNTITVAKSPETPRTHPKELVSAEAALLPTKEGFIAVADRIADDVASYAVRRGPAASWIGLEWMGEAEVAQLTPLGPDLYSGVCGVAVFLAAHAAVTGNELSGELALAAIVHLRKALRNRDAARMARALGIGGMCGLGSIVYALAIIGKCLGDKPLVVDAEGATLLFTDDLIAADQQLDLLNGSAGAILGLLRIYRDTGSTEALKRAVKCGEHLLNQPRVGSPGCRSWVGKGVAARALNGMSHGASGFAHALTSLAAATGREDFAAAAAECIAFEDASYDEAHGNWPDLRASPPAWPCQWCHGATGIGLARIATAKRGGSVGKLGDAATSLPLMTDIGNAVATAQRQWPGPFDTLCCGTLGSIELFHEAAGTLGQDDLRQLAARRLQAIVDSAALTGDYRWNTSKRRFNVGLFRGAAGVGYTLLRRVATLLPNVLLLD